MNYQVRWKNSRPYCWQASTDGGATWHDLKADDDADSSEAIQEAADAEGIPTNEWQLIED